MSLFKLFSPFVPIFWYYYFILTRKIRKTENDPNFKNLNKDKNNPKIYQFWIIFVFSESFDLNFPLSRFF